MILNTSETKRERKRSCSVIVGSPDFDNKAIKTTESAEGYSDFNANTPLDVSLKDVLFSSFEYSAPSSNYVGLSGRSMSVPISSDIRYKNSGSLDSTPQKLYYGSSIIDGIDQSNGNNLKAKERSEEEIIQERINKFISDQDAQRVSPIESSFVPALGSILNKPLNYDQTQKPSSITYNKMSTQSDTKMNPRISSSCYGSVVSQTFNEAPLSGNISKPQSATHIYSGSLSHVGAKPSQNTGSSNKSEEFDTQLSTEVSPQLRQQSVIRNKSAALFQPTVEPVSSYVDLEEISFCGEPQKSIISKRFNSDIRLSNEAPVNNIDSFWDEEHSKGNDEKSDIDPREGFMLNKDTSQTKDFEPQQKENPHSTKVKTKSWDGDNIAKNIGYFSPNEKSTTIKLEEQPETAYAMPIKDHTALPKSMEDVIGKDGNNQFSFLRTNSRANTINTVVRHQINDFPDENHPDSPTSMMAISSKKDVNNWATEGATSREAVKSYINAAVSSNMAIGNSAQHYTAINSPPTKNHSETSPFSYLNLEESAGGPLFNYEDTRLRFNSGWLSLFLVIVLSFSVIGGTILFFKNWELNRGSNEMVFNYFGTLTNKGRSDLIYNLTEHYNIDYPSHSSSILTAPFSTGQTETSKFDTKLTKEIGNHMADDVNFVKANVRYEDYKNIYDGNIYFDPNHNYQNEYIYGQKGYYNTTFTRSLSETSSFKSEIPVSTVSKTAPLVVRSDDSSLLYAANKDALKLLSNNPKLHQTFHGLSYAPMGVIEPICGTSLDEIILDLAVLSQVTKKVRTYGTQCNQADYILQAIEYLGIDMKLALGVWIGSDDYTNWKQMNDMKKLLKKYPRKYFDSIFIGNEVLFRREKTTSEIIYYIKETKDYLYSIGYQNLAVGTSELGSFLNEELIAVCDFIGANVHPFFSGQSVQEAMQWTIDYSKYQVEPLRNSTRKETDLVISEVGWPSGGGKFHQANAGINELQYFLDEWVCTANQQGITFFYFEAFDEPWKKIWHEGDKKWETQWGLFTADRQLKDGITLPNCAQNKFAYD